MAHIRFQNVSKIYSRQSRQFLWRYLTESKSSERLRIFALRDVSIEVGKGRSLAVIGNNGAGKSTLLSLVAGLTSPEVGTVDVAGRVMALLELGSGFHPDLTGRENLEVNAALCGLTRREMLDRYDAIVDFAGIADFINEPLRTYSQGMILRLAFAVGVHVDPDIVLLDEVLVVGDRDFQRKCFQRILEMKGQGKILLCVSHVPELLMELCDDALWLESGRMVAYGPAAEVIAAYQEGRSVLPSPPG